LDPGSDVTLTSTLCLARKQHDQPFVVLDDSNRWPVYIFTRLRRDSLEIRIVLCYSQRDSVIGLEVDTIVLSCHNACSVHLFIVDLKDTG
jgi:hypothetical protein